MDLDVATARATAAQLLLSSGIATIAGYSISQCNPESVVHPWFAVVFHPHVEVNGLMRGVVGPGCATNMTGTDPLFVFGSMNRAPSPKDAGMLLPCTWKGVRRVTTQAKFPT